MNLQNISFFSDEPGIEARVLQKMYLKQASKHRSYDDDGDDGDEDDHRE